jgi:hypothetical protein
MSVISATKKAEIGKVKVQGQPGQTVLETPSQSVKSMAW